MINILIEIRQPDMWLNKVPQLNCGLSPPAIGNTFVACSCHCQNKFFYL
ncbi:hypothetical protein [Hydrotalea sp. AMD]|nr:hypothetical protein [Hydrotalea sp. AMD]